VTIIHLAKALECPNGFKLADIFPKPISNESMQRANTTSQGVVVICLPIVKVTHCGTGSDFT